MVGVAWSRVYDSLGRLTSVTEAQGGGASATVGYGYDLDNDVTTITYPGSVGTVTQGYNTSDQMTSIEDWNSKSTTIAYSKDGEVDKETMPTSGTSVVDTFTPVKRRAMKPPSAV